MIFKKVKYSLHFIRHFLERYGVFLLVGVIFVAIAFLASEKIIERLSIKIPEIYRIGTVGRFNIDNLPNEISSLISSGLIDISLNGTASSSAIVNEWKVANEGKQYIFKIKKNTFWQDGSRFDVASINYEIAGTEIKRDKEEVTFDLESVFAPFPSLLTKPIVKDRFVGLGKYIIRDYTITSGTFSDLVLADAKNTRKKIHFKFYPNEDMLISAFKLGQVDEVWNLNKIDALNGWQNITILPESTAGERYAAIFFNTRRDLLAEKRVRQALAYALEKPKKKDRCLGPISPNSWAYNKNVKEYPYDPEHAKTILKDISLEGIRLEIRTIPELLEWAEKISANWQTHLGVETEVHVSSIIPSINDFDVYLGFGIMLADPDQYTIWHSTQQTNFTGLKNEKIDQLLEKGRQTIDVKSRTEIYQEFQKTLLEESPAVFLFFPTEYKVARKSFIAL